MTAHVIATVEQAWPPLAPVLFVPHTQTEYDQLVKILDTLIDVVQEDEAHSLASLMEIVGVLIETYEDKHFPEIDAVLPAD